MGIRKEHKVYGTDGLTAKTRHWCEIKVPNYCEDLFETDFPSGNISITNVKITVKIFFHLRALLEVISTEISAYFAFHKYL